MIDIPVSVDTNLDVNKDSSDQLLNNNSTHISNNSPADGDTTTKDSDEEGDTTKDSDEEGDTTKDSDEEGDTTKDSYEEGDTTKDSDEEGDTSKDWDCKVTIHSWMIVYTECFTVEELSKNDR